MIRKISILVFLFTLITAAPASIAEEQSLDDNTQDNMEVIKISDGYTVIAPKGAKVVRKDGQIIIEDTATVLLRRVGELENQIDTLKKVLLDFKKQLDAFNTETENRIRIMELQMNQPKNK